MLTQNTTCQSKFIQLQKHALQPTLEPTLMVLGNFPLSNTSSFDIVHRPLSVQGCAWRGLSQNCPDSFDMCLFLVQPHTWGTGWCTTVDQATNTKKWTWNVMIPSEFGLMKPLWIVADPICTKWHLGCGRSTISLFRRSLTLQQITWDTTEMVSCELTGKLSGLAKNFLTKIMPQFLGFKQRRGTKMSLVFFAWVKLFHQWCPNPKPRTTTRRKYKESTGYSKNYKTCTISTKEMQRSRSKHLHSFWWAFARLWFSSDEGRNQLKGGSRTGWFRHSFSWFHSMGKPQKQSGWKKGAVCKTNSLGATDNKSKGAFLIVDWNG